MRDYAELVKALRCCSKIDARNNGCDSCPYEYCGDDCQNLCGRSADAIEELLAESADLVGQVKRSQEEIRKLDKLLSAVPHWISVEDEPPKENDRYLVRYKRVVNLGDEETVREDEIRIMRFFVGDGWRYPIICNDYVRLVNEEVTHWMPLPEPPKEG